jgi:hypothetical protein
MFRSAIWGWIGLNAIALAFTVLPVRAETAIERYLAASKTFDALKAEANAKGEMPRISDPRTAEVLAVLADAAGLYGTPAFPAGPEILDKDICSIANKAGVGYSLFGLDALLKNKTIDLNSDQKVFAQQIWELQAKNFVAYQDEVLPLVGFGRHCMAGVLPTLTSFVGSLPAAQMTEIRRDGLRKMRLGIKGMIVGSIAGLGDTGTRDLLRIAAFNGLKRDLPQMVPALSIEDRAEVMKTIKALAPKVPIKQKDDIVAMLEVLDTKTCEGLCTY